MLVPWKHTWRVVPCRKFQTISIDNMYFWMFFLNFVFIFCQFVIMFQREKMGASVTLHFNILVKFIGPQIIGFPKKFISSLFNIQTYLGTPAFINCCSPMCFLRWNLLKKNANFFIGLARYNSVDTPFSSLIKTINTLASKEVFT